MRWFRDLSIGNKVRVLVLLGVSFQVALALVGRYFLVEQHGYLEAAIAVEARNIRVGARLNRLYAEQNILEKNIILADSEADRSKFVQEFLEAEDAMAGLKDQLVQRGDDETRAHVREFAAVYEKFGVEHRKIIALLEGGDRAGAIALSVGSARSLRMQGRERLDDVLSHLDEALQ